MQTLHDALNRKEKQNMIVLRNNLKRIQPSDPQFLSLGLFEGSYKVKKVQTGIANKILVLELLS